MAKAGRPVPGSRAETLLDQLLTEVKGLRADLRGRDVAPNGDGGIALVVKPTPADGTGDAARAAARAMGQPDG